MEECDSETRRTGREREPLVEVAELEWQMEGRRSNTSAGAVVRVRGGQAPKMMGGHALDRECCGGALVCERRAG